MSAKIFRINYKSDFILTLNSDAGWMTPFCIKFWTGAPSQAYFVGWDGETYTHCAYDPTVPTKLLVQFDDHHLPIGDLKFQIAYHFTVADFPNDTEDEVINPASIIVEINGEQYQVMLDFTGETAPEIAFSLPAYANEAQRIANEQARIAAEQQRIANEDARIQAEETRQYNEQQRIQHEEKRVSEFARLKSESEAATTAANAAATLANEKAQLADDKATLAQAAATLANEKAQLAADKAALAQAAATLANEKAALAQQKATYAQTQGDYAKEQGDYAKAQGDTAQADHVRAEADHTTAADDHSRAEGDHTTAASDHSLAESDHTTAASDHSLAESDHTTAASDHSRAESDHTTSASDHTRAEADHTTAASDHETAASDHTRAESDHAAVEVYVDSLGAFDISSYHATGGELAKYADLTAALGTDGANIPEGIRKGGMSVKFVQSSDNKYVQYRLMADTFSNTESDWQGVDDVPTDGSKNLVKSGGVSDRFDIDESNLYGKEILEEEFEATANIAFQKIYPCLIKKGYVLDIDIEHNRTSHISINFMDENENILQSFNNVPEDDFPLHLTAAQSSAKIRFVTWSAGFVTVSGEMTFKVKIIGELPKIKDDITTLNSKCNNLATEIESSEKREKEAVGRYIPKLEVGADNTYISTSGIRVIDNAYYLSKSVLLFKGDIVTVKYAAGSGNFAAIVKYNAGTTSFTPLYNKAGDHAQNYIVEEDVEAYFSCYKDGTSIVIDRNNGISGEVNSIEENCPDIVVAKNKITITSAGMQQHRFICSLKKGDLIYVKLIDSKIDTASISLMDSNDNVLYSSGSLSIWKFPHQICVPEDCSYMRLAVWNASWIIETGDMTVLVKKYNSKPLSIQDNLQTDTNTSGDLLAIPCRMIKNGAASPNNYGIDGVHYEIDVNNNFSKMYMYFEWQAISALADGIFTVAKLFNGKYRNYYSVGAMAVSQCGNVYRTTQYGNAKEGTNTLKNFVIPSGLDGYDFADAYFSFAGKDAIWIRYTGENRTAVSMKVKSDGIVVTVGEDSRTFNFASSDLLSTVIDTISAETDLEAGWYKCGSHTFGELLKNDTLNISLLQEIPGSGNIQDIITNPRVYLPLALDEEWHSCEILVDIRERTVSVNTDGFNTMSTLDSDVLNVLALDKSTICIGDAVDSSNCPVRFRNLDLQIDSDGGAEIINYNHCIPQPNGVTWRKYIKRMISPRNPNIVIYECHGVIVGKDSDVDPSTISFVSENGMACTTDRLMNILAKAKDAGYEFVSFQDILEWKLYGKRLPKRCMAMMFDDFRIDNYLDYDKKYPFTKYGITPGLAIVTNPSRDLDEEVTYNGLTCTYREAMQIIKDAGWYLSSHSYNHRNHVNMQYSDRLAALKLDDIYAKPYRVQMEVYTYGGNNYDYREDSSMKAVPVSIGIGGEVPDYICKGSNQYNLTRYDCGLRISYANSIAQLV